jgi:hypothetical protein
MMRVQVAPGTNFERTRAAVFAIGASALVGMMASGVWYAIFWS